MSAAAEQLEQESAPRWIEPFAAMFWRIRVQSYLLMLAFVVIAL